MSYGRLGPCAKAAAGHRSGPSGAQLGTPARPGAFADATVRCLRHPPAAPHDLARLEPQQGQGTALPLVAHQWARAVDDRRTRAPGVEMPTCRNGTWRGAGEPPASQAEPGRSLGAFILGPRVLIDNADLPATGLLSFGSRANFQLLLKGPPATVRDMGENLRVAFANQFVRSRGYWQNQDRIGENLSRAENYLSLVGLVILILGGIGVSSVTRVFVEQKIRSIAILKCVGGR